MRLVIFRRGFIPMEPARAITMIFSSIHLLVGSIASIRTGSQRLFIAWLPISYGVDGDIPTLFITHCYRYLLYGMAIWWLLNGLHQYFIWQQLGSPEEQIWNISDINLCSYNLYTWMSMIMASSSRCFRRQYWYHLIAHIVQSFYCSLMIPRFHVILLEHEKLRKVVYDDATGYASLLCLMWWGASDPIAI